MALPLSLRTRTVIVVTAGLAIVVMVDWLIAGSPWPETWKNRTDKNGLSALVGEILLGMPTTAAKAGTPLASWFVESARTAVALAWLGAALAALHIARRQWGEYGRTLAMSLAFGALAIACLYFVANDTRYASIRSAHRFIGYAIDWSFGLSVAVAFGSLVRFGLGFPRPFCEEDLALLALFRASRKRRRATVLAFLHRPAFMTLLLVLFLVPAAVFSLISEAFDAGIRNDLMLAVLLAIVLTVVLQFMVVLVGLSYVHLASQYFRKFGTPEERDRTQWVRMGFAIALLCFGVIAATLIIPGTQLWERYAFIVAAAAGPAAIVAGLLMATLYRGDIDPNLVLKRATIWGAFGIVATFLFLLGERTVAALASKYLNLSPGYGPVIAAVVVALGLAPLRTVFDRRVSALIERKLPATFLSEGDRAIKTILFCDISGYTALSARDEKSALVAAAVLHREARAIAERRRGRIVKTMGDAVMAGYDAEIEAVESAAELHLRFNAVMKTLQVSGLELHSGLHRGEVIVARDGDLYGQSVNIAARIQGSAEPAQIVMSEDVATHLPQGRIALKSLGHRIFKNVPDPVACLGFVP